MTPQIIRQKLPALATICLLAVTAITVVPASAKVVQAPGSRVSMDLPEKFKPSPLFSGFMEIISSAAIISFEMPPEAYEKVIAGFTPEALAKKGITNVKKGQLERSGDYLFVTGEQKHPRAVFNKFILVIKDAKNTAIVTFNVPKGSFASGSIKREAVIKALTTAKLEAKAAPSKELFKLGYIGPFEQTGAVTGTTRVYTETADKGPKASRNIMVIAPSLNRLPIANIKDFSKYALDSLNSVKDYKIKDAKDVTIDKMAGHQITATATSKKTNVPVIVRQLVLLPPAGGYFRLITITKVPDDQRLAPEIEKVFNSFKAEKSTVVE